MLTKESLSFRNRYAKYLLIWVFVGSFFCLVGPTGFSTQLNEKAQIESVIGFRQWVRSSESYHKTKRLPHHFKIGSKSLYSFGLKFYNSTVNVRFKHNQSQRALFEPFRFFVIPKIIPPGIDS